MRTKKREGVSDMAQIKRLTNFKAGDELDFVTREAYNVLRTNLTLSFTGEKKCRVVGVTSSTPHEGKSFTSINLCYALAKDNYKVLLLSGDLRKPMVESFLRLDSPKGLSNILTGDVSFEEVLHENILVNGLSVVTAGTLPPNPSELLGSEAMRDFLAARKPDYDYIVIDLPPVISVIDPISVSKYLDGMIAVIMHTYAHKKNVRAMMTQFAYAGVRLLGFVYNGVAPGFGHYYRKGKYYKKNYGYYKSEKTDNASEKTQKG